MGDGSARLTLWAGERPLQPNWANQKDLMMLEASSAEYFTGKCVSGSLAQRLQACYVSHEVSARASGSMSNRIHRTEFCDGIAV